MRIVLTLVVVLVLSMAVCSYLSYRFMKPKLEEQMRMPGELKMAKVITGEGVLRKETFYEEPGLGSVTEIRRFGAGDAAALAVVGASGASFLGNDRRPRKRVRFEDDQILPRGLLMGDVVVVDLEGDGTPEFLARGKTMTGATLFSSDGKVRWRYKGSWLGVNDAAAGDVDGDGKAEVVVAHNAWGGLHLVDSAGKKRWERGDTNVWHVEILDTDGDGRGEILHTNAGGELIVRSGLGEVVARYRPTDYISDFSATRWGSEAPGKHLVACDEAGIHVFGVDGQRVARLKAPSIKRLGGSCQGAEVRFLPRAAHYATLQNYPLWKRSVLYLHDSEGKLAYHEVLEENCGGLAATPRKDRETLLVGCNGKVYEYSLADKSKKPPSPKGAD